MSDHLFVDGPDGPNEFSVFVPGTVRLDLDLQEQVESPTFPIPRRRTLSVSGTLQIERVARERLFYRVRGTYPQPDVLEGRSGLTVAEALR